MKKQKKINGKKNYENQINFSNKSFFFSFRDFFNILTTVLFKNKYFQAYFLLLKASKYKVVILSLMIIYIENCTIDFQESLTKNGA